MQYRTLDELFPVGSDVFMLGSPHYGCMGQVRARLYWRESDIDSRWILMESNSIFPLSSDKDQRKEFAFTFPLGQCK